MKWRMGLLTVLIFAMVLAAGPVGAKIAAAPSDHRVFSLGTIVVTGQDEEGSQVAIGNDVTAAEIVQTHSLTVPEALRFVPGVTVTTGRKNEPEIRIHGFDQHEALILIDGIPYYETNYGKLNLNQLPTGMIARIDVIKGAPSVLYGPNAMAGVINIITKKQTDRPTFSGTLEVGDYGNYHFAASHGNSLGKFKYWFQVDRRDMDGWRMSSDFNPREGSIVSKPGGTTTAILENGGERNNSDYTQTSLWGKVGLELGPRTQYYLSAYFIDSQWGFPPSTVEETIFPDRPAFSGFARMDTYQDWGVDLSGEQAIGDSLTLRAKLFYHSHIDDYVSYSDATYSQKIAVSRFKDYFMGLALFADWQVFKQFTLRGAFHYRGDSHQERADEYLPFAEAFSYTGSVATEAVWRPFKGFSVVAGVSYDWFNITKSQANETDDDGNYVRTEELETPGVKHSFNPMIGISYSLPDTTRFFASVARKTRFPTLQQMFSGRSGNIDLDPEYSINYTLGVSRSFGDIAFAQFSVFYHDVRDRISRDGPGPNAIYLNYAKIRMYGLEVGGNITPFTGLRLSLNYTYLHAQDDSDESPTDNVIGAPEHKVDLGITYTIPKLGTRLHLQGMFMAEQFDQLPTASNPDQDTLKTGSYFLANFKISQPLWDHFEIFAYINNIFDRDFESEYGFPGMGRNFWIGIRAQF